MAPWLHWWLVVGRKALRECVTLHTTKTIGHAGWLSSALLLMLLMLLPRVGRLAHHRVRADFAFALPSAHQRPRLCTHFVRARPACDGRCSACLGAYRRELLREWGGGRAGCACCGGGREEQGKNGAL